MTNYRHTIHAFWKLFKFRHIRQVIFFYYCETENLTNLVRYHCSYSSVYYYKFWFSIQSNFAWKMNLSQSRLHTFRVRYDSISVSIYYILSLIYNTINRSILSRCVCTMSCLWLCVRILNTKSAPLNVNLWISCNENVSSITYFKNGILGRYQWVFGFICKLRLISWFYDNEFALQALRGGTNHTWYIYIYIYTETR